MYFQQDLAAPKLTLLRCVIDDLSQKPLHVALLQLIRPGRKPKDLSGVGIFQETDDGLKF